MNTPDIDYEELKAVYLKAWAARPTDKGFCIAGLRLVVAYLQDKLQPRLQPIAEMPPEVPEGCERVTGYYRHNSWHLGSLCEDEGDTHFIDIRLPEPPPDPTRESFEQWVRDGVFELDMERQDEDYVAIATQVAWKAWQAAKQTP